MKIFNLKSTTRDIHIIQDSPFKGKQDLEIKHKRHVPVLHGNKTIINITQTYAHTILLLCKYCYQKVRKKKQLLLLLIIVQEQLPLQLQCVIKSIS